MLTDIWGKRLLLCIFARPIKIRCIFFWACIKNYHLSQKTTDDNSIASKEKKMHIKALIILPSLKCAIALLLYSLALSSFSLQFILIPSV